MNMSRWCWMVTPLMACGSASATEPAESVADKAFAALTRRYLREFPQHSPVGATGLGDHRFDGELDEITPEARERTARFNEEVLAELARIPRSELSRANQVDATLLEHEVRFGIWGIRVLKEWSWNPLRYTELAGSAVYSLMAREFAPVEKRLESAASRLEQFPRYLREVRSTLAADRVPRIHAETAVKQNRGVLSTLDLLVKPRLGALAPALRDRIERAMTAARAAIEEHQTWLEKDLLPRAAGEFRLGAERFDQKLAFMLQSRLSRQDVLERAQSELARVREELYLLAKEVYLKEYPYTKVPVSPTAEFKQAVVRAALEVAYRETPEAGKLVERARQALEATTRFVKERDLVTVPDDPIEIIVMPEFQRGVSLAYCDAPGPLDAGQKTFYAVSPIPDEWNDTHIRSFLREYNTRSLHDLTIHEAMPGHYLQLAHSNRRSTTLRAVLSSGPFIEGWAIYTEQMMADEGYYGGDPLMKLIARKWYLRGIANAILDQSVHAGTMTRDEAMKLMIEDTFQEEREAAAKWVRAQLTSAQLSTYFVGYQEHADLRREVQKAWGGSFTLKKYHDAVLSYGSPPVKHVRALMMDLPIPQ
ncbi:MAG TPA: DUF885 domain-containing protein [Planctomycetota bacterium]|nr:DUF885 domain-containing protein [Planctomycetota bacterium]